MTIVTGRTGSSRCRRPQPAAPSPRCSSGPDRADVRCAHRIVPVGRSHIARPVRPPERGPRRCTRDDPRPHRLGLRGLRRQVPTRPGGASRAPSAASSPAGATRPGTPISGAYGKYQIMPSNWPAWARQYLGNANAKPTPANQEKVAAGKMTSLYRWLGSWKRVAYWWLTGSSRTTGWSSYAKRYVAKVMRILPRGRRQGRLPQGRSRGGSPTNARSRSPTPGPGDAPSTPGTAATRSRTRSRPGRAPRSRSAAARSPGTARRARRAARPRSTSTASTSRP